MIHSKCAGAVVSQNIFVKNGTGNAISASPLVFAEVYGEDIYTWLASGANPDVETSKNITIGPDVEIFANARQLNVSKQETRLVFTKNTFFHNVEFIFMDANAFEQSATSTLELASMTMFFL